MFSLTPDFNVDEIKCAIWDYEGGKSPSPCGYNFKFLKSFWNLLKYDITAMVNDFHVNGCQLILHLPYSKEGKPIEHRRLPTDFID
ncbi:hypothetical protein Lal_00011182 [Lupinus albus]|nr:hypothetical protein Lal_00011182 [Lupinus albus]